MPLNDEESLIHYNQQLLLLDDENLTLKNQSLIIDYFFYREVLIEYMRSTIFPADCKFNQVWRSIHIAENRLSTQDIYKLVDSCPTDVNDLLVKIINYTITRCYKQNAYSLLIKTTKINSSDLQTISRGQIAISQAQLKNQSEKLVETLSKKSDNLTGKLKAYSQQLPVPGSSKIDNNTSSGPGGAVGAFLFLVTSLSFFSIVIYGISETTNQTATEVTPTFGTPIDNFSRDLSLADNNLSNARLVCELNEAKSKYSSLHEVARNNKFNKLDYIYSKMSSIDQRILLIDQSKSRNSYYEDCAIGVGYQSFDKYEWIIGQDFTGSFFGIASKKCNRPAITFEVFKDNAKGQKIYEFTARFFPDADTGMAERTYYTIPAANLESAGNIEWKTTLKCSG